MAMLSRVVFLTVYIISSAWRMRSWALLASSGKVATPREARTLRSMFSPRWNWVLRSRSRRRRATTRADFFIGLRKQDDELIAAVAEGVVDEAEVVLDGAADFGEQAAADEVAAVVIDQLEVVEIEEDDAELVAEAGGAVDLGFDAVVEVARVVEAGAVVGDGEFLDLFDGAGVVDGDGGVVGHGLQEHELIFAEAAGFDVDELDDAEDAVLGGERDAEDGAGLPAGHLVDAGGEALVLGRRRERGGARRAGRPIRRCLRRCGGGRT